jgi:hypothetical protein
MCVSNIRIMPKAMAQPDFKGSVDDGKAVVTNEDPSFEGFDVEAYLKDEAYLKEQQLKQNHSNKMDPNSGKTWSGETTTESKNPTFMKEQNSPSSGNYSKEDSFQGSLYFNYSHDSSGFESFDSSFHFQSFERPNPFQEYQKFLLTENARLGYQNVPYSPWPTPVPGFGLHTTSVPLAPWNSPVGYHQVLVPEVAPYSHGEPFSAFENWPLYTQYGPGKQHKNHRRPAHPISAPTGGARVTRFVALPLNPRFGPRFWKCVC